MKPLLIIVCLFISGLGLRAQTITPGQLAGTYVYRMASEPLYTSTLYIKKNGRYQRVITSGRAGETRKTTGTWEIKGENLWLTPAKKYNKEAYSLFIGNGYLKIGEMGIHEKQP